MDDIILLPYAEDKLLEKIQEMIRTELQGVKPAGTQIAYTTPGLTQKPIFKAAEVCAMLQVSRQTLHSWAKEGILKPHKIKSRSFYLWNDIEKLIHNGNY